MASEPLACIYPDLYVSLLRLCSSCAGCRMEWRLVQQFAICAGSVDD